MRVLFAAAEAYPFAKVGGLADVGGALPKMLARLGHEVRLVLPGYSFLDRAEPVLSLEVPMGRALEPVRVCHYGLLPGVSVYTLENEKYLGREHVYGYEDDDARFILFSKAVVAFAALSGWRPDVIHCHDWHLGLAPQYARCGPYNAQLRDTGIALTIHNLSYQGHFGLQTGSLIGLNNGFEGGLLARGIAFADVINTVSDRYLKEILTPEHGMGLDGLLRSRLTDLHGILNGVDYEEFDPGSDPHIAANYDTSSVEDKRPNKLALQERSGLVRDPEVPLLGMVARLVDQKGIDLVCAGLDEVVAQSAQVVIMGVGDEHHRRAVETAAARHPGAVSYHATDQEALARLVYAGSDLFLAPSAYEPCGLGPLIALRYGAIPIVRRTGGMADTIRDYSGDTEAGLGFTFVRKYRGHLVKTVKTALDVYRREGEWQTLQRRAMAADFSWEGSSRQYEELYQKAIARRRALATPQTGEAAQAEVSL